MKGQEAFHPIPERDRASRPRRGQQLLDVFRPPQKRRQHLRGEANALAAGTPSVREVGAAVTKLRPAHRDRADPGLDLALGCVPVADDTPPAMRILVLGMRAEIRLYLGLDHLLQHPPRPIPQHQQQRIIGDTRSWQPQSNNAIPLPSAVS